MQSQAHLPDKNSQHKVCHRDSVQGSSWLPASPTSLTFEQPLWSWLFPTKQQVGVYFAHSYMHPHPLFPVPPFLQMAGAASSYASLDLSLTYPYPAILSPKAILTTGHLPELLQSNGLGVWGKVDLQ